MQQLQLQGGQPIPTPEPTPHRRTAPHLWAYYTPSRDEAVASRSYTKNLERVMSESSSSPSVTTGSRACEGAFSPGTTAADVPLAIAKDIPAAPHIGKAFERLRLEACLARAMTDLPDL